jgi:hypothetical protein
LPADLQVLVAGRQGQQDRPTYHAPIFLPLDAPPARGRNRPGVLDDPLLHQQLHGRQVGNLTHDRAEPSCHVNVPENLQCGGRVVDVPTPQNQSVCDQPLRHIAA